MKLYNPFKWHVVKQGEVYFVRKFVGFWLYLDTDLLQWTENFKFEYCALPTKEKAFALIESTKEKVIHE